MEERTNGVGAGFGCALEGRARRTVKGEDGGAAVLNESRGEWASVIVD